MNDHEQSLNDAFNDAFNYEIARELLLTDYPDATEAEIQAIQTQCKDNPWNAAILYKMIKLAAK